MWWYISKLQKGVNHNEMKCCVYGVILYVFTDLFTFFHNVISCVLEQTCLLTLWMTGYLLYILQLSVDTLLKKSAICHSDPHSYDSRLQTYVTKINSWGLNRCFRLCFQIWILKLLSIFNAFCRLNVAFNWILMVKIMRNVGSYMNCCLIWIFMN